jgi:hypothetical protein
MKLFHIILSKPSDGVSSDHSKWKNSKNVLQSGNPKSSGSLCKLIVAIYTYTIPVCHNMVEVTVLR